MRALIACLWISTISISLYAAMSDAAALKTARAIWGPQAMIGQRRDTLASNWSRIVGYSSVGCFNSFTVIGEGFNTWDAAFADAEMHPAKTLGPFKGMATWTATSWDNVAVAAMQAFVDGVPLPEVSPDSPVQKFDASQLFDTSTLTDGLHVMCITAKDTSGNIGRSPQGNLFQTDQINGTADGVLKWQ